MGVVGGEQFFEGYTRRVDDFRPYRVPKLVPWVVLGTYSLVKTPIDGDLVIFIIPPRKYTNDFQLISTCRPIGSNKVWNASKTNGPDGYIGQKSIWSIYRFEQLFEVAPQCEFLQYHARPGTQRK